MNPSDPAASRNTLSGVLSALAAAVAERPYERKVLVCRRMGVGRELLRSLAARGVPWTCFEVATVHQLAHELVAPALTAQGFTVADEFDELALLDAAIDAVLSGGHGRLAELAEGTGLRRAIASSVRSLRQAGVGVAALERSRFRDEDKRAHIARILDEYERLLHAERKIDGAAVLAQAAATLTLGDARIPGALYLLPGQSARGLTGQLLAALLERGAQLLPADPVVGLDPPAGLLHGAPAVQPDPTRSSGVSPLSWLHDVGGRPQSGPGGDGQGDDVALDLFAATSVTAELREVLRRVLAAGLRWDEVEIITTDATAYGVALDGLARRLGIPVSYAAGLPAVRTRPGRAVASFLAWLEQGCPADLLRQMLERGDLAAPEGLPVSGFALARRLRGMRVGRGLDRYLPAVERAQRALAAPPAPEDGRPPEEVAAQREVARRELDALAALLRRLIEAAPRSAHALDPAPHAVTPADVAASVLALLEHVPAATALDRGMKRRLRVRLERIASTATRPSTLGGAIAVLRNKLDDHVPAPEADGTSPWASTGGHLHLSDLEHGGWSGRRATFVVGLDAARFPGSGGSDALLVDDDRRRIASAGAPALPTAAERIEERRYAFAALVARLRGRVTWSYATWDAVEGRSVAPAAELLQAYRLVAGDATADYERLHKAVEPLASAVPRGAALLDADDVWLAALADGEAAGAGGALRRGVHVVNAVQQHLAAGVAAWKARLRSNLPTPHHGFVEPRPSLDPRDRPEQVMSATQLQVLGACPHRYLLRYVLRIRKPDDPVHLPEQWLPPLERGALLHAVYEGALRAVEAEDVALDSVAFEHAVMERLAAEVARYRALLPPPGEAVFGLELERLREDARAFVAMVRQDGRRFIALERTFGPGLEEVRIGLPDGTELGLRGAIDRVDRLDDGRLVVIDYKTGSSLGFGGHTGAFDGGRRLQHVLYSAVAERLFGSEVARAEYQFPSRRSENHRARYDRRAMADGLGVVTDLLDLVRNGWFTPTNTAEDCRFCDFAAVCRVSSDGYGKIDSPLAEWAREVRSPAADVLRRVRR